MESMLEKIEETTYEHRNLHGGDQFIIKFANGYGASIVRHQRSYGYRQGLWELAVIHNDRTNKWPLCYKTPITNDVIGWLEANRVGEILYKIKGLPYNPLCNHWNVPNWDEEDNDEGEYNAGLIH